MRSSQDSDFGKTLDKLPESAAKKVMGAVLLMYAIIISGFLAFWGTIIYILVHFVHKYWNR